MQMNSVKQNFAFNHIGYVDNAWPACALMLSDHDFLCLVTDKLMYTIWYNFAWYFQVNRLHIY